MSIRVPPSVSEKLDNGSWPQLLKAKREDWQPQLAYLVSRHAAHLDRWQLGADFTDAFVRRPEMREVYRRVYAEFAALVEGPDLAMPWPAYLARISTLHVGAQAVAVVTGKLADATGEVEGQVVAVADDLEFLGHPSSRQNGRAGRSARAYQTRPAHLSVWPTRTGPGNTGAGSGLPAPRPARP